MKTAISSSAGSIQNDVVANPPQAYSPALPGINAPGSYDDYAKHPGAYWTQWAKSVEDGTNAFFKP